jgi:hypothetical protein
VEHIKMDDVAKRTLLEDITKVAGKDPGATERDAPSLMDIWMFLFIYLYLNTYDNNLQSPISYAPLPSS